MYKISQFKTQCKGDISHACKTAKITIFNPVIQMRPYKTSCSTEHFVVYADNWRE